MFNRGIVLRLLVVLVLLGLVLTGCVSKDLDSGKEITEIIWGSELDSQSTLRVHIIDVGQGDAILIQAPTGETMLIDGGDRHQWVADRLLGYLKSKNVTKINTMVLTHPHADHVGGLNAVLDAMPVSRVYDAGKSNSSATYQTFLSKISQKNIPYYLARRGNYIYLANDVYVHILHPTTSVANETDNNASVVLRVSYKNVSFMLTGDAETGAENSIINSGLNMKSQVLKVGHHGSSTSTSNAFLDRVAPTRAAISVGEGNTYGHPSQSTIDKLNSRGISTLQTRHRGHIVYSTDGNSISITTSK